MSPRWSLFTIDRNGWATHVGSDPKPAEVVAQLKRAMEGGKALEIVRYGLPPRGRGAA
jgi:hypothetical protein